jgi:hypothetical protein
VSVDHQRVPWILGWGRDFGQWLDSRMPPCEISAGHLECSSAQPYRGGDTNFLLIVDTTAQVTNIDATAPRGMLLNRDSLTLWFQLTNAAGPVLQSHSWPLEGFPDGTVNGAYLRQLVRTFLLVGLPFSVLILIVVALLSCLLQAYLF